MLTRVAKQAIEASSRHIPQIVKAIDGKVTIAPIVEMFCEREKDQVAELMRDTIATKGFEWCAFITEAFSVEAEADEYESVMAWKRQHGTLEGHPACKEQLQIVYVEHERRDHRVRRYHAKLWSVEA